MSPGRMHEVRMKVRDGKLTIETATGGTVLDCERGLAVTARLAAGNFVARASLSKGDHASDPLQFTFRPELGEVGLPHAGAKAKFD
jgi:hypothetical protein